MKILLIYPYRTDDSIPDDKDRRSMPIGVYYIGAMLRAEGYDVQILNWSDRRNRTDLVKADLKAMKPDVIGFSVLTFNRWGALQLAAMAKQIDPAVVTVFGGVGATFQWRHFLTHFALVDYVVLNEGEYRFLELIRYLENPTGDYPESINGLAFRKKGSPFCVPADGFIADLDALPDPARYFDFDNTISSRGCPHNCAFCSSPGLWQRKVRYHSADYMVEQMERLKARGVTHIYIADDTFTMDKRRAIDICQRMLDKQLGLTWTANSRVDCVDAQVLRRMRMAGCQRISYGVESGAPEIRKRLCKGFDNEQIVRAFALTASHGIITRAYFIIGAPGENWDTIYESIDLMRRIKPMWVLFSDMTLMPGTALYRDYMRQHGLDDDLWLTAGEWFPNVNLSGDLPNQGAINMYRRYLQDTVASLQSDFVKDIELIDDPAFKRLHADFLATMGKMSKRRDYMRLRNINTRYAIADRFFRRALTYFPDHAAFRELAGLLQHHGKYQEATQIIRQGLTHYPQDPMLAFQMALCLHKLDRSEEDLAFLEAFLAARTSIERERPLGVKASEG